MNSNQEDHLQVPFRNSDMSLPLISPKLSHLKCYLKLIAHPEPTIITSIKIGDKKKTVSNYANSGPPRLHELEIKIDEITNSKSYWEDLV
jgi:hypothetical protein